MSGSGEARSSTRSAPTPSPSCRVCGGVTWARTVERRGPDANGSPLRDRGQPVDRPHRHGRRAKPRLGGLGPLVRGGRPHHSVDARPRGAPRLRAPTSNGSTRWIPCAPSRWPTRLRGQVAVASRPIHRGRSTPPRKRSEALLVRPDHGRAQIVDRRLQPLGSVPQGTSRNARRLLGVPSQRGVRRLHRGQREGPRVPPRHHPP
jgi:hypothetical protein